MEEMDEALARAKASPGLTLVDLRIPQDSITLQMLQQAGVEPPKPKKKLGRRGKRAPARKVSRK